MYILLFIFVILSPLFQTGELQGIKHGIYTAIPGQMISTGGGEHQLMQAQTITPTATQLQTAQPVPVQITGGQCYTSTQPYMSSASSYTLSNASTVSTSTASSKPASMSMQLPTGGITAIIQQGTTVFPLALHQYAMYITSGKVKL